MLNEANKTIASRINFRKSDVKSVKTRSGDLKATCQIRWDVELVPATGKGVITGFYLWQDHHGKLTLGIDNGTWRVMQVYKVGTNYDVIREDIAHEVIRSGGIYDAKGAKVLVKVTAGIVTLEDPRIIKAEAPEKARGKVKTAKIRITREMVLRAAEVCGSEFYTADIVNVIQNSHPEAKEHVNLSSSVHPHLCKAPEIEKIGRGFWRFTGSVVEQAKEEDEVSNSEPVIPAHDDDDPKVATAIDVLTDVINAQSDEIEALRLENSELRAELDALSSDKVAKSIERAKALLG